MQDKTAFHVGGVPEHFNLPWHLAIEQDYFSQQGIEVKWHDYPGGTGAMTQALESHELDIAISLTEGIASRIITGGDFRILQNFVISPLTWGVYVSANSEISSIKDLKGRSFAISRKGSGSHLMAFVYVQQNNWQLKKDDLVLANNLQGMVNSLNNGEADILLWEKYTTQPYVDQGYLKLVDTTTPPWPSFVMAARNDLIINYPDALQSIQQVINQENREFMNDKGSINSLAKRYDMSVKDAESWFNQTNWATDNKMDQEKLRSAVETLYDLNLVPEKWDPENLTSNLTALQTNV